MARQTVIFWSMRTGKHFANTYSSESSASRAVQALTNTHKAHKVSQRKAKGFKFSKALAALNRKRY